MPPPQQKPTTPTLPLACGSVFNSWAAVSGVLMGGPLEGKKAIARLGSAQSLELGQTYDFAVSQPELKFFDRQSEKRVEARELSWQ